MSLLVNTRISISASNLNPVAGEPVTISGKLEYYARPLRGPGIWTGLSGKTVHLIEDNKVISQTSTDLFGNYSFTFNAKEGAHTYYTKYNGD